MNRTLERIQNFFNNDKVQEDKVEIENLEDDKHDINQP